MLQLTLLTSSSGLLIGYLLPQSILVFCPHSFHCMYLFLVYFLISEQTKQKAMIHNVQALCRRWKKQGLRLLYPALDRRTEIKPRDTGRGNQVGQATEAAGGAMGIFALCF